VLCLEARRRDGCVEPPHGVCEEGEDCSWQTQSCLTGYAHFGVVDRARHTIDWRWRTEVGLSLVLHEDRIQVAAFGDGAAILYEDGGYPPWNHGSGWAVVPMPAGEPFGVSDQWPDEWLAAALVADGNLHLILGQTGNEGRYRQLTITKHGARSSRRLDRAGPLTPGRAELHCLAEGTDGTVTVSLPYRKDDYDYDTWRDTPADTLTLRYRNAFLPQGPDVFPSARAACAPRIAAAADARWVRATFDDQGVLIVYTLLESDGQNGSLYVERRAR
jgi:hypothetical protein